MIFTIIKCPDCKIGIVTIQEKSGFYTTFCGTCKKRCVYLTKNKEKEFEKLALELPSASLKEWKEKCKKDNIRIIYIPNIEKSE